jgi:hypothetical protein
MTNEKKHFGVAGSHHLVMHAHIASRLHIIPFPIQPQARVQARIPKAVTGSTVGKA